MSKKAKIDPPALWWEHHLNLAGLYEWLTEEPGHDHGAPEVLEFLRTPWSWEPEWKEYLATGGLDHNE